MSSNNVAAFIVSRHQGDNGWDYRVQLQDGTMRLMEERSVRCLVRGDIAIDEFNPDETFDGFPPPMTCMDGPRIGDVIRVNIQGAWHVCTVLDLVADGPTYKVRYDDGMLIHDRLNVPWTYVATSPHEKTVKPQKMIIKVPKDFGESMAAEPPNDPMTIEPVLESAVEPAAQPAAEPATEPAAEAALELAVESACEAPANTRAADLSPIVPNPEPRAQLSEKQRGKLPMGATPPNPFLPPCAAPDWVANVNMAKASSVANNSRKGVEEYASLLDVL